MFRASLCPSSGEQDVLVLINIVRILHDNKMNRVGIIYLQGLV